MRFINEFNSIVDAINQGDIINSSGRGSTDKADALVRIISNANGINGNLKQADDIFRSIITTETNGSNLVASRVDNDPVQFFLDSFNMIADSINMEMIVNGIKDIVDLLEIISTVLGVISFTGIPEVVAAKVIIDAITGIANLFFDDENSEVIQEDIADEGSESAVNSFVADPIDDIFNDFTEIVTEVITNAENTLSGFAKSFNNFFGF